MDIESIRLRWSAVHHGELPDAMPAAARKAFELAAEDIDVLFRRIEYLERVVSQVEHLRRAQAEVCRG